MPRPAAKTWDDLWSRLCHQGTVYPASPAALPALIALAEEQDSSDAVQLATEILGSTDGAAAAGTDGWRRTHPAEVARLHAAAVRRWGSAAAAVEQVYALRALLLVEAAPAGALDRIADEKVDYQCPACGDTGYVALRLGGAAPEQILPASPAELTGWQVDAHRRASNARRDGLAVALLALFGRVRCAGCGETMVVLDRP